MAQTLSSAFNQRFVFQCRGIRFYKFTWLKYLEASISGSFRGLERATDLLFATLLLTHIAASRALPPNLFDQADRVRKQTLPHGHRAFARTEIAPNV